MTLPELIALAEAALEMDRKATAGEWRVIRSIHGPKYSCVQFGSDPAYTSLEQLPEDAAFIASARTREPQLARAVLMYQRYAVLEHDSYCKSRSIIHNQPCDCGLDSALASLTDSEKAGS